MRGTEQDTLRRRPLAYRLRDAVHYGERNGSPLLVLRFPLTFIVLHPFWKPVLKALATGDFMAFETILSRLNHADPQEIEIFLNSLVRRGFLEQEGFLMLSHYPFVSIIIPVRNRPEEIAACLQSLGRLDYPAEKMEIIVVDDASDDNTPEVVSTFPVHLIPLKEHKQASFCRNLAAHKARSEVLAFLDSDCMADPLWLRELVPAFSDPSNGAAGGVVDSYYTKKGLDRYEKVRSSLNMGSWPKSSREENRFFYLPSCNLLIRRALFVQVGGFREDMVVGEDVDLCWRLQDQGYHVEYRPVGRVYHKHRNRMINFCARRFDYGTSEPLLQQSHMQRVKQFLFSLPAFFFWVLVIVSFASGWMPVLSLCGVVLVGDSLVKRAQVRHQDIPIGLPRLFLATFRSYLAFCYHCCAFVSRYYLVWAPLVFIVAPLVSAIIVCMHLVAGIGEYGIKRPRLSLPSFLFFFTVDQISYQLGVWWYCLKKLCFSPVNPQIVIKSSHRSIR
jgi:mycofactocin system glycosyltransferase